MIEMSTSVDVPAYRPNTGGGQQGSPGSSAGFQVSNTVQVGDLMVFFLADLDIVTLTTPAGWTLLDSRFGAGSNNVRCSAYWRIATAEDVGPPPSSLPVTFSGNARYATAFAAYSGCDPTSPIEVSASALSTGNGATATSPSVTTTVPCLIIECFGFCGATATEFDDEDVTGPDTVRGLGAEGFVGASLSDQTQSSAGATGTTTASARRAGSWVAMTIAVKS